MKKDCIVDKIIKILTDNGGEILYHTFGGHRDKDLGKISVLFGEHWFNAWFNVRTGYFHSPYYNHLGYRGNITNMKIQEGLETILKLSKMKEFDKDLLTEDGQFACPDCKGKKVDNRNYNWDGDRETNPHWYPCFGCDGTGYLAKYYERKLFYEKKHHADTQKEFDDILKWIEKTSKCKTCKGKRFNTPGMGHCNECGLEGNAPWGG